MNSCREASVIVKKIFHSTLFLRLQVVHMVCSPCSCDYMNTFVAHTYVTALHYYSCPTKDLRGCSTRRLVVPPVLWRERNLKCLEWWNAAQYTIAPHPPPPPPPRRFSWWNLDQTWKVTSPSLTVSVISSDSVILNKKKVDDVKKRK